MFEFERHTEELDRYLDNDHRLTPGTGSIYPGAPEPLPKLQDGVPLYDATIAWIAHTWGGYDKMPVEGRRRWNLVLGVSRGHPGDKTDKLKQWAQWLASQQYVEPAGGADSNNARTPKLERLLFEPLTQTIRLDGTSYKIDNAKAFAVYQMIAGASPQPVTKAQIQKQVSGCKGTKTIPRLLGTLPEPIRLTVPIGDYNGYHLDLNPPSTPRKKGRSKPAHKKARGKKGNT